MATTKLNINTLVEKAEQLVYDGKISGAEKGIIPVQEIEIEGKAYKLSVMLELPASAQAGQNQWAKGIAETVDIEPVVTGIYNAWKESGNKDFSNCAYSIIAKLRELLSSQPVQGGIDFERTAKEIARDAWTSAASTYRLYPENKHTFVNYWNDLGKNLLPKQIEYLTAAKPQDKEVGK